MTKINVTKPYLPPKSEYQQQVSEIFDNCILTNQGPKVQELESTLKKYLQAENFSLCDQRNDSFAAGIKGFGN